MRLRSLLLVVVFGFFFVWGGCTSKPTGEGTGGDGGPDGQVQKEMMPDTGGTETAVEQPVDTSQPADSQPDTQPDVSTPDPGVEQATPDMTESTMPDMQAEPPGDSSTPDGGGQEASTMESGPEGPVDPGSSRTCEEVRKDYSKKAQDATSCSADTDCHIINGHCGVGLGGCWYTVNKKLTQEQLNALQKEWSALSCTGGVCDCAPPPKTVQCVSGKCEPGVAVTCDSIKKSYTTLASSRKECQADTDCHVLSGHCGVGLGGCHYIASKTLTQKELDALAKQWQDKNCTGPVCRCAAPPDVKCDAGQCVQK